MILSKSWLAEAHESWSIAIHKTLVRTRQIGANPEISDLLNFRGPD